MDERTKNLIDECKRQEESCLYTSACLYEWLKSLRFWRFVFIVAPIILGSIATSQLLLKDSGYKWLTGLSALLAGVFPAVYKALGFDISLTVVAVHAHKFKVLQDRFRQSWRVTSFGAPEEFKKTFDVLMSQMDDARSSSLTAPERFFGKAKNKINAGHYNFNVDSPK